MAIYQAVTYLLVFMGVYCIMRSDGNSRPRSALSAILITAVVLTLVTVGRIYNI